jgi:hypothetical protein
MVRRGGGGGGRGARKVVKPIRTTIWAAAELGLITEDETTR